ncbi:non-ribosomal peptide synthetase [Streptosporangium sp. NBC_01469]|uniref:non-ribosomal peptide synthetase n=1 Tax=Streptosporangium sp. NBC_01469 TaxID=2903898 RepID=UPI002E286077|nr:non-ribosomal peptide synthetase [Streptosporangium sp. NBC_01469]
MTNVENIYKLTPLQSGMLFHVLYDSTGANPYVAQSIDEFVGPLDVERLRLAWQAVVDRHSALRSVFVWEGLDEPVQVVQRRVELPFEELDWRSRPAAEQKRCLEELVEEDRVRGFDLGSAPLLRLTVVRFTGDRTMVLWTFHHLLLDGWSTQVVQKEVFAFYRAATDGTPARLAEPIPYARYIGWLSEQSKERAEEFWRRYLGSFEAPTDLGIGATIAESDFGDVKRNLGPELAERLGEFARAHRVTVNTVVQGAWALLLSRYSGSDDIVHGSTVSGRPAALTDAESIVGLFINTLPVRTRVPVELSVAEWLHELQDQHVELRQYEYTSLVDAQGWSAVPKGKQLFKSILVFENYPKVIGDSDLPEDLTVRHQKGIARTGYPLTIAVGHTREQLLAEITYDRSLFEHAAVERLAGHFGELLSSLVADPGARVGDLELLSVAERRQLLVEWNEAVTGIDDAATLHGLVQERAREHPEATAVVYGEATLSYGELNIRANQLAHHLRRLGVGSGSLVGVCLERGLDLVVGLLGVLKAGGAYVPLDPAYPAERLAFLLDDTAAPVVVTHAGLRDRLPDGGFTTVALDADRSVIGREPADAPASKSAPNDLAYVIYTSGSTGVPKGVLVEHRSVVNRLRGTDGDFGFGPEDVWTLFHSFAFDFSVWEIWGALTYGGRLVVVDAETVRNADAFADLLVDRGVTVLNQTPSAFGLLQQVIGAERAGRLALRLVVFGGEALQPARLGPWWEAVGENGPRLVNMYGITETTVHVTAREITETDSVRGALSPIGRPLADTGAYVLDAAGRVAPVGVAGELWISGTGVARGYLNRPELTAERFVTRELAGVTRRLYRSGDLVRWMADGELEYLGRLDDQVKVRGHRIELGEVETALVQHPGLETVTVVAREDVPGEKRLVAYAVPTADYPEPSVTSLRDWCGQTLPDHMVPGTFVFLDEIPLTGNGKVDRKALPAPGGARPRMGTEFVAPCTEVEEAIARIWTEVLGVNRVGVHDNFFELGGDSILAIQVISRAKRYGLNLTPRMIFKHQTVAEIFEQEQLAATPDKSQDAEALPRPVPTRYGLSPLQSGMLFHSLYDSSDVHPYTVQFLDEFVGPLDVERLRLAWQAVVDRHSALRSVFVWEGLDEPVQVVQRRVELPFEELDWRSRPTAEQKRCLEELVEEDRVRGFDLGSAPLLRLTVVRFTGDRTMVLWTFHHLLLDGWSAQLVMKEVFVLYRTSGDGSDVRLADPVPYARFIEWLGEQSTEQAEEFWRARLGSFTDPTDLGIGGPTGKHGFDDVEFRLDAEASVALGEFARAHRVTMNTVVQGAWALLLSRYSGSDDIVHGSIVSGRHCGLSDAESMIGLFINTLPVRTRVPVELSVAEWLHELQDQHVELRQYEYTSLVDAQGWSAVPKGKQLFKSILVFQNFPGLGDDELPDGLVRISRLDVERTGYPITAIVYDSERLKVNIAYDRSLFEHAAVERLAGHFGELLSSLVADPGARVGDLELLSVAERRQLLVEWNEAVTGIDDAATLHGLVQERAREHPEATAVVYGEATLSYGELNIRANQLAHHLRRLGVGSGSLVGVCLERGLDLVVGLLGVLKAGGAYVPLDPAYPAERLAFLLDDTAAPVVVTHAGLRDRLPDGGFTTVALDADRSVIGREPADAPASKSAPNDLAYVIYTSGSTGVPKGVLVEHRSVVNRLRGTDGDFGFGPEDVWTLFHSFAFDFSVWEIWGALTYGGRLVVVDAETVRNADAFADLLVDRGVTVLNQTPSAFGLLQQVIGAERAGRLALRLVVFGGEALQPARLGPWWEAVGENGPRLVNMYGITETTVHVTAREITETDSVRGALSPIGRPLADTGAYVLDAAGRVAPVGVAGELWISGTGVARGYLNRPELTAERFVTRELAGVTRRLYRSGDLVRWMADGELEYLGRLDDQVKVRGHRIELGEVETALVQHPGLETVTVVAREDVPGEKRLVAYAVPTADYPEPSVTSLRDWCGQTLPDHMVPGTFVFLDEIPLTGNGKVDRKALPAPGGARPRMGTEFVAPCTEVEEAIARIWTEVLGVNRVGVHDNFFELGGDSILAIQVISRAKRYGLNLTPRMIFKHQTVAEIARHSEEGTVVWAEQGPVHGEAALTPIQQWFFELNMPNRAHFNQSRLLETEGLDPATLEEALGLLLNHHDALRLRFKQGPGGWTQTHAANEVSFHLACHDFSMLPEADVWNRVRTAANEVQQGMDLMSGPLLRAALFNLGTGRGQRLLLAVHHLAIDGVSWRILLQDLADAYRSLAASERVILPLKTTSYQAWSARLQHYATTAAASGELAYWTRPRSATLIPRDRAGENTIASFDSVAVTLDSDETASLLRDVPRVFDARINDLLLTAVAHAIRTWTGEPAALVALEGHGREDLFDDVDLSRTVGWFTSIFPIELRLAAQSGLVECLASVQEQLAEVPHHGVGYGILRYWGTDRTQDSLRAAAWPEISFNYLGQFDSEASGFGRLADEAEPRGGSVGPDGERAHLIDITASVHEGLMSLSISYSRNVHKTQTAAKLAQDMAAALRTLVEAARKEASVANPHEVEREAYGLSPMQAGMLFQSLADTADVSEVRPYVVQFVDEFTGPLDVACFRRSWQEVVDRHTIVRSVFTTDGDSGPLQRVRLRAVIPFNEVDWRDTDPGTQQQRLERLLDDDRRRGFDLAQPPLMRFVVARVADNRTVVVWSFHHLLFDGWSAQLVQQEFYTRYRAALTGEATTLPVPVPYARYIAWLAERSQTEAEKFWRDNLAGVTEPTALGVDRETELTGFGDVEFTVEAKLAGRLGEFAKTNRLTVNTIIQGMWTLLLSRYSGSEDVLYGSTVSGRPADLPGVESMVGLFINTLPVRAAVPAEAFVIDWLRTLQERHVELRQYEYSALVDIQRWSEIPSQKSLFRSILIFENYPKLLSEDDLPQGLTRRRLRYVERTGYPLVLGAAYTDSRLDLHIVHDRGLIDDEAAQRMASHLLRILAEILDGDPEKKVGAVELLTEAEQAQLAAWNGPELPHPDDVPVHALIELQARQRPDAVAVEFDDETLTYRGLNERANQLAHQLRALGIGPEAMVGLCLERGLDMIVALLGILKSGGAYVPLDTQYPPERLAFMIEDTALSVVITQQHLTGRLPGASVRLFCLDRDADLALLGSAPTSDPEPLAGPENLAYVIYTSGSTGKPKGVMIEHRSMSDRVQEMQRQYQLSPEDAYLQFSSVTFDGSVGEIFPTLIAGARLVPRGDDWTPAKVLETIRTKNITVCQLPPFVWNELISQFTDPADLGEQLRLMSMGGERVLPASVKRWFERTSVPLFNIYGPTETTVNITTCLLTEPSATVPIGAVVANTDVLVVDGTWRPTPVGVPGELWIGGKGVARGYLNRPELTDERFVNDPRSDDTVVRMYRTGDLVRWLPDGQLDFLGRIDDQIKLRGFRIELGEIESTLTAHPRITAGVVLLREDDPGVRRLVAYCLAAPGERPVVSDLREWCARGLPDFMVPTVFVFLDALPVTANGKGVDRKALPPPQAGRSEVATRYVAPTTPAEKLLAEIWCEVLTVDQVGANDNFFELGGDSFLGMQVIAKARRGGVRITPRLLFQNPTITELATCATEHREPATSSASSTSSTSIVVRQTAAPGQQFAVFGTVTPELDTRVSTVMLNRSTAERTLFAFHEGAGNVSGYVHLAEALASTVRVIGIESRSVAFGAEPEADVAVMARQYWKAIRAIQPTGPYLLAGYSFGGALAIETTRLIEEAGDCVDLLIALDSCLPVPGAMELVERDYLATTDLLRRLAEADVAQGDLEWSEAVVELMTELNLPADMLALRRSGLVDHLRAMEAHTRSLFHYQPPTVSCPVLLYQAESSPWAAPIADSWSPFVTELNAWLTPGDHLTFMRAAHAGSMAKEITRAIVKRT